MLAAEDCALLLIDVQGTLAGSMYRKEWLFSNLRKLVGGALILEIPILWVEQAPDKLGRTIPEIADLLTDRKSYVKTAFSCMGDEVIQKAIMSIGRSKFLVCGIETHICVYQTAGDILHAGFDVEIVADATSSRSPTNRAAGLERMKEMGARLTTVEMVLFEMLGNAEHQTFRRIQKILK